MGICGSGTYKSKLSNQRNNKKTMEENDCNQNIKKNNEKINHSPKNQIFTKIKNEIDYNMNYHPIFSNNQKNHNLQKNKNEINNNQNNVNLKSNNKIGNNSNIYLKKNNNKNDFTKDGVFDQEKSKIHIFWLDPNVDNEENTQYRRRLENSGYNKIKCFKTIENGINSLKLIKFEETFIIVSGGFFFKFIEDFKEALKDIYVIPKIIVFTKNKTAALLLDKGNNEIIYNPFYNMGGFQINFKDIKDFISNKTKIININFQKEFFENKNNSIIKALSEKEENNEALIFEYIDSKEKLILPSLYKILLESSSKTDKDYFSHYLYNKYKNFISIKNLLESIIKKGIPSELLSKYYIRIYTDEKSKFYNNINKDLRENKKENYLSFIKVLYEGLYSKSLPLASNNTLYRGSKLSNDEIKIIKTSLKNKIYNLPGLITFSKTFLSFSKDDRIAKEFLKGENIDNLSKVFFILEKDNIIDHSLSTHADIENISFFPNEKEVLFFPFSSFEIKDMEEQIINNEMIYIINLKYLGKYIKDFQYEEKEIPNSKFKEEILKSGLIEKKKSKIKKQSKYITIIINIKKE